MVLDLERRYSPSDLLDGPNSAASFELPEGPLVDDVTPILVRDPGESAIRAGASRIG
jgi:hypothetical protein